MMRFCVRKLCALSRRLRVALFRWLYGIHAGVKIRGPVTIECPNISFGANVTLYQGIHIWGGGRVIIGNNVAIGKDTIIYAAREVVIDDDAAIGGQSYIIDCDHGTSRGALIRCQPLTAEPVYIGRDVWIGAGAKVLRGSRIGEGAIIGALSLVKGEVEPYSINVGVPVRKIGERE